MIKIATHNGSYHTDDLFAVAALKLYLEQQGETVEIIRTRDADVIAESDYAVDVGTEYAPERGRFDHHQEGGAGERENGIPYAAFGLIWQEYGAALCDDGSVAETLDRRLVQPIDAPDNGVSLTKGSVFAGVYSYYIQDAFNIFRPTWKEESKSVDEIFTKLIEWATVLLQREIKVAQDIAEGEKLVAEIYEATDDKRVIRLEDDLPWKGVLCEQPEPLFVIYPKDSGRWRLRAIPEENFGSRAEFPADWRGKRGKPLQAVTGVDTAVFCHNSYPMVVAETKEGIEALLELALAAYEA